MRIPFTLIFLAILCVSPVSISGAGVRGIYFISVVFPPGKQPAYSNRHPIKIDFTDTSLSVLLNGPYRSRMSARRDMRRQMDADTTLYFTRIFKLRR